LFIALEAVTVAGGMLLFSGELNDFASRLMYFVLVAGILLGATPDRGPVQRLRRVDRWRRARRQAGEGRGGGSWLIPRPRLPDRVSRAPSRPSLLIGADREWFCSPGSAPPYSSTAAQSRVRDDFRGPSLRLQKRSAGLARPLPMLETGTR
jgi:hypothetical protein